jgi:hypothetical protein
LHEKQIEREADQLLAEYAEILGPISEPPVPVEELPGLILPVKHRFMDLKAIFPFADVHGAIWFQEAEIGVDSLLNPDVHPRHQGRYHFTLAHEIGHWRLHRGHYLRNSSELRLFEDGTPWPDVVCRSSERKKPVEWQADTFAAHLLMPRRLVYTVWSRFREGDDRPVVIADLRENHLRGTVASRRRPAVTEEEAGNLAAIEEFCAPLAKLFEVSPEAMRIRLEALELFVHERQGMLF